MIVPVKFVREVDTPTHLFRVGRVYHLPEPLARPFVAGGVAFISKAVAAAPEAAATEPPEVAVKKRPAKRRARRKKRPTEGSA